MYSTNSNTVMPVVSNQSSLEDGMEICCVFDESRFCLGSSDSQKEARKIPATNCLPPIHIRPTPEVMACEIARDHQLRTYEISFDDNSTLIHSSTDRPSIDTTKNLDMAVHTMTEQPPCLATGKRRSRACACAGVLQTYTYAVLGKSVKNVR
ncbi:hypothetical protein TNCV_899791 [Trichonephila clavipes]|nr:hypothetical protein TNCV_899791 [Trichonephila clavipes]